MKKILMLVAAVSLMLAVATAAIIQNLGGPTAVLHTFVEHEHSIAYHFGDKSWLDEGDHHARVCDNSRNGFNAYVVVAVNGDDITKYDKNGADSGCGDIRFTRNGEAHKTCEYQDCGQWSIH